MNVAIVAITKGADTLARRLAAALPSTRILVRDGKKISELLAGNWQHYDGFICIMATGIVVRAIAPLLQDKRIDPAVVVVDEAGRHAISLLSGHIGGGNSLAREVAAALGGTAIITTASDTLGHTALDLWALDMRLTPSSKEALTAASAKLVNNGNLLIFSEYPVEKLPADFMQVNTPEKADVIIGQHSGYPNVHSDGTLILYPPTLVIGIGCNRNTPESEIAEAQIELFTELNLSALAIRNLASIDKKNDEPGLLSFAGNRGWRIDFFDNSRINSLTNLEISSAALKAVGAIGVAEPTALLSAGGNLLLCRKRKWKNVTMAIAQAPYSL